VCVFAASLTKARFAKVIPFALVAASACIEEDVFTHMARELGVLFVIIDVSVKGSQREFNDLSKLVDQCRRQVRALPSLGGKLIYN